MSSTDTTRPATELAVSTELAPAGSDSLNGQSGTDTHRGYAVEGLTSPQANAAATPRHYSPAGSNGTRPASRSPAPNHEAPAGPDSLSGQRRGEDHGITAAEGQDSPNGQGPAEAQSTGAVGGQDSPQATAQAMPKLVSPAGNETAQPAIGMPMPKSPALAGHENGRDHRSADTQATRVPADHFPAGHAPGDTHRRSACGEQFPPAATARTASIDGPLLADPLLALAADVLDDLEKARISNENRLRQLTRSTEDKDGETRGFGLDEAHPDVARLAALVGMLGQAEHQAALNLARLMRKHPLGPWLAAQKGIGERQGPRLLAAIGDPYIRPQIEREDGTVEASRPRTVSELWAFCGYHVTQVPVSGQPDHGAQLPLAADGQDSHPGHVENDAQRSFAGVAPKRARGQKANWSGTAKMRAYLVAVSCMKQPSGSRYRDVYEAARAKYDGALHKTECIRCGPKGKPAPAGSPLSDGHKLGRALRAVAKEVLEDLWHEAKRLHETCASGHRGSDTHEACAAGAPDITGSAA